MGTGSGREKRGGTRIGGMGTDWEGDSRVGEWRSVCSSSKMSFGSVTVPPILQSGFFLLSVESTL